MGHDARYSSEACGSSNFYPLSAQNSNNRAANWFYPMTIKRRHYRPTHGRVNHGADFNFFEATQASIISLKKRSWNHTCSVSTLTFISVYCIAPMFLSIICFALFCIITVTMVFYSNLCFIVNLMPFTVSGQPFRTMFYVSMHFCDFIVVCTFFLVYKIVCSLPVTLPGLANKDVHWQKQMGCWPVATLLPLYTVSQKRETLYSCPYLC